MPRFLGRVKPSAQRLARLAPFAAVATQLPAPPAQIILPESIATPAYAGTLGNTTAGDCTIAGAGRLIQAWSAANGNPVAFSDEQALAEYGAVEGYDPATGQPDDGCVETDVLDYWVKTGMYGNKLDSYAAVQPASLDHVRQTIWVFGGIYLGLDLPRSAEEQTDAGQPWTDPFWSPILGGHCVVGLEYDENYIYVGTWGVRQPVSWDFFVRYFDAAYALANAAWIGADGKCPGGLVLSALVGDLPYVAN